MNTPLSAKPSVVFFNRVYPPGRGASGRMLRDLARGFSKDGWDVTIVTTGTEGRMEKDGQITIIRLKAPQNIRRWYSYLFVWLRLLLRGLRLPRHDLVVSMTDPPLFVVAGCAVARLRKSRHIHWCQDLFPDIFPAIGFRVPDGFSDFLKNRATAAMKKCDRIVTIGRCMAKRLARAGIEPSRIAVVPNWPDYELLSEDGSKRLRARTARRRRSAAAPPQDLSAEGVRAYDALFKDADRKFRVMYSGNLGRAHPYGTITEAASLLQQGSPDVEFIFVGDGPNFDRLATERSKRGLENIRFLPYQPASLLRGMLESGDIHIITMENAAAGMMVPCKLYSAFAVARPCVWIGPDDTEPAKVIRDFGAGEIVAQDDAEHLARVIRRFRDSSDAWFSAHDGAAKAGEIFVPSESIGAWLERAWKTIDRKRPARGTDESDAGRTRRKRSADATG
jgi:glycosyltransferase involved in cell wall biosynthesis